MNRVLPALCLPGLLVAASMGISGHAVAQQQQYFRHVCAPSVAHHVTCDSIVLTDAGGRALVSSTPSGYGPADLQSAYNLPSSTQGSGQTVAIVDAYGYPTAQADLSAYRAQYGLPPCTAGCFNVIDQNGGTHYPAPNGDWDLEQALDIEMVSAICPNCHILLVEANTDNDSDLYVAENQAAQATWGATAINNSWSEPEFNGESAFDSNFNHPGIAITVSSGDSGYGVSWPTASEYVTGVGGTRLTRAGGSRGWTESAWSGAGSGCSAYIAKPSWQKDKGCKMRTVADVSAVASPDTPVAIYVDGAWSVIGGTSVASPIIAGVYALAGNGNSVNYGSYPYGHTSSLYDVIGGSNGKCNPKYLCHARKGYDGPTGLGTPNGTNGF